MNFRIKRQYGIKLNAEFFAQLSIVLFFSYDFVRMVIGYVFSNSSFATVAALVLIYMAYFFACAMSHKYLKSDFYILFFLIILFFTLTYLIHPEYKFYYTLADYGVWAHVLIPFRGIYAYLFIRLLDKPDKVMKCLKTSGWLMLIYFIRRYRISLQRGYWYGIVGLNAEAKMSYSVEFGYSVLPFALLFLYFALKEKKPLDFVASLLAIFLIFVGGSRGPVLFIGVFVILYMLIELKSSRRKTLMIVGIFLITVIIYAGYQYLILALSVILRQFGISSRFLMTLLEGSVSNDSGRFKIWSVALQMIKENPLGYGAMGSRHIIHQYIAVGYPHSILLEFLIDFGVGIGAILLIVMFVNSWQMLFKDKSCPWRPLFLIYFSSACSLFLSLTFWSTPTFWVCLGLIINQSFYERKKLFS